MQEPIWNDKSREHTKIHHQNIKEANGYCLHCQKPLQWTKHYLCINCQRQLKVNGSEHRRVSYKTIGELTINYQQSIHRRFFGCNAPYKYRGEAKNRVRTNIKKQTIEESANKLNNSLLSLQDCELKTIYTKIQNLRNTQNRLLYAITLYSIAYYILESKEFKHKAHFQASIVAQLENDIKRMYIRTHFDTYERLETKWNRSMTLSKKLYELIHNSVSGILLEVY